MKEKRDVLRSASRFFCVECPRGYKNASKNVVTFFPKAAV